MNAHQVRVKETSQQPKADWSETGKPQSSAPQAAIRINDLWKRYDAVEAVRGIHLEVGDGEIFGLIGPDGAGKTTTFQILAGVMEATAGTADVFGQPAREMRSQ